MLNVFVMFKFLILKVFVHNLLYYSEHLDCRLQILNIFKCDLF